MATPFYPAVTLRNVLDDPFIVRDHANIAGQFTFVYDPTPATWFWMWIELTVKQARLRWR